MWEHVQRVGSDPLEKLNSGLFQPAPKTTNYRGAASRRSRDPKVRENHGQTYTGTRKSAGWNGGNYQLSKREQQLQKHEDRNRLLAEDRRRAKQDAFLKEALAYYAEELRKSERARNQH